MPNKRTCPVLFPHVIAAIATFAHYSPCTAQPWPPPYAVFELPTLGGTSSYGWTLDERGNVIGSATLPNRDFHATVWLDGQHARDLGTLGGEDSACRGINSSGWIVGWAHASGQSGFDGSAFLWRNGRMMNLGNLGGDFAEAYGINDLNQIVGWAALDNSQYPPTHAFLWENGQMTDLGTLDGSRGSQAIAINDSGLIVGQATSALHTTWRPVVWENGQITDLGTFRPDNGGVGICIDCNELNDVVGYTARADYFTYQAFIYRDGLKEPLPERPRWRNSYAWSINDHREIVGACRNAQYGNEDIGCIWEWQQPPQYLHDLIPPQSNWFIGLAIHNNNAGQITGTGVRVDSPEYTRGYLLTPVHPTMELSGPSPGISNTDNTLALTGATPGATVHFLYSRQGGGTRIPGCDLQQNALQLDSPTIIGSAIADANGIASITRTVPLIARGQTILFQAVVHNECAISQLVVHTFE